MQLRLLFCIAMGVFVAHLGVLMIISHFRPQPHSAPPPKRNFTVKSTSGVDLETGEKVIYREITVSTKFAPAGPTPPPAKPQLDPAGVSR
jgi:hypothetical protein